MSTQYLLTLLINQLWLISQFNSRKVIDLLSRRVKDSEKESGMVELRREEELFVASVERDQKINLHQWALDYIPSLSNLADNKFILVSDVYGPADNSNDAYARATYRNTSQGVVYVARPLFVRSVFIFRPLTIVPLQNELYVKIEYSTDIYFDIKKDRRDSAADLYPW